MEGFPRDVQNMILRMVAQDRPAFLVHLFCVNRMFRTWVTRFVMDYCFPRDRVIYYIRTGFFTHTIKDEVVDEWDIINRLKDQWKNKPTLFVAFCMCADAYPNGLYLLPETRQSPISVNFNVADTLFFKRNAIICACKALSKKRVQHDGCIREIAKYQSSVENYTQSLQRSQARLDKNLTKRGALEDELKELESKLKKKK